MNVGRRRLVCPPFLQECLVKFASIAIDRGIGRKCVQNMPRITDITSKVFVNLKRRSLIINLREKPVVYADGMIIMTTTIEMLVRMPCMLRIPLILTEPFSVTRRRPSFKPVLALPVGEVIIAALSPNVSRVLRANGCTRSILEAACISGTLRSITEMPPQRRVMKDGSPPRAKAKETVEKERAKVKEKERKRVVVNQVEKEKARIKERAKARASLRAKVKAKAKERVPTDVMFVARHDLTTLGLQVAGTPTARECALKAETRTTDPEEESRFGSCAKTFRVNVKLRTLPAFLA
jgi:hypothetical protein